MRKRKYKKLPKTLKKFFKKETNGNYTKKESKPERECRLILEGMGVDYIQEFNIKHKKYNKFYDFFVFSKDKNICYLLEINSYFHDEKNIPEYQELMQKITGKKPRKSKVTKTIKKNLRNDKLKANIAQEIQIPLIIIWQYEIEHFPKRVVQRIKNEWQRQENAQI